MLKLALVGCGAISAMHLLGIREGTSRIRVTAAVDVDPGAAGSVAEQTGAAVYASLEQALAEGDFDAVDLMLPHQLHEEAAIACLRAGKHVILEKPMAPTVESCGRILAAAKQAPGRFLVAENAQYWPDVVAARELIDAGEIGELVTARAQIFFPPMQAYYGGERPWRLRGDAAGGGVAMDTGSHWIRPLRMWLGEVDEVVAALGHPFEAMESESLVRSLLRFRSGRVASFDALLTEAPIAPETLFRITGSRGEITIDGLGNVTLYGSGSRGGRRVGEPGGYLKSYAAEFADFERVLLDGEAPAAGPEAALGELRTALAMYRSAESHGWEKVWD